MVKNKMSKQTLNQHNCSHILTTGKNKGKQCSRKRECSYIPYCKTHKKKHQEEVDEIMHERQETFDILSQKIQEIQQQKQQEYREKLDFSRDLNISTIFDMCCREKDTLFPEKLKRKKTENTAEKAVDIILMEIVRGFWTYNPTYRLCNFWIHDYRGYEQTDIITELNKRGFITADNGGCIYCEVFGARDKYLVAKNKIETI